MHPNYCTPFLQPGRLLYIKSPDGDFGWGVLMQFVKRVSKKVYGEQMGFFPVGTNLVSANKPNIFGLTSSLSLPRERQATPLDKDVSTLLLDVMVYCSAESKGSAESSSARGTGAKPVSAGGKGEMKVITCTLSSVEKMSLARLFLPKDLRGPEERKVVHKMVQETRKRCKGEFPILSPVEHLKIKDNKFLQLLEVGVEQFCPEALRPLATFLTPGPLEERLKDHPLHNSPELEQTFNAYAHKMELKAQVRKARRQLSEAESVVQLEELKARKRVLRRLGYTTSSDVIELKGRVSCEISAGDEILLTEMMFNGVFNELSVEHTVGLLSCFVCDEVRAPVRASKDGQAKRALPAELEDAVRLLKETASRIAKVSQESKLQIDEEEYLASFRTDLVEVVLAWCGGAPFSSICKMTDIFEGSIIRNFRRLDELLCQMSSTAKAIGNGPLENKFTAGIAKIKRDIVFAASLYL
ncbi:MAG: NUC185 domain-containing protein [Olpidium bornovanus]|uniref:NUC185 domain-containing protein n=1 Tax=Olpidium bornovanus TaxID=278681 RepID=A0A8H7ZT64_9FUNG|nr:MAG: NUC185 domain-containing protein [Olpidium bornovanus]